MLKVVLIGGKATCSPDNFEDSIGCNAGFSRLEALVMDLTADRMAAAGVVCHAGNCLRLPGLAVNDGGR